MKIVTKLGTKSSQYGLYRMGYTHVTMEISNERQVCEYKQFFKLSHSPDCSLQLENMKQELLVIVNQQVTVNRVYTWYTLPVTPGKLG